MSDQSSTIVQRLWNYCNVLWDDGMSYGDYVEQLTYLLFLKMDHENSSHLRLDGDELERHYRDILAGWAPGRG
jgi:type I restriction enzyme M protein